MSIIFWNCQGLDNALIVQTLREMVRSHTPSLIFLMETKQKSCSMNQLRKQCGYHLVSILSHMVLLVGCVYGGSPVLMYKLSHHPRI
ncbi:hypothetical protein ACFX12_013107 [Malus domestica]